MSVSEMPSASFDTGLPAFAPVVPWLPMSPPALFTRMWMAPNRSRIWPHRSFTVSSLVRSPCTASTSPPDCSATSAATASKESASPKARVEVGLVPWSATLAPSAARWPATTRPMPREEPVTHATLPANRPAPVS